MARTRKVSPNPAVDAQIDHRRKRPDVFPVGCILSKCAGNISGDSVQRKCEELVSPEFWDGAQGSQCDSRQAAPHYTDNDGALERDISGREARDRSSNPHPKRNWNTDEQYDLNLLAGAANLVTKQNRLEVTRAHDRTGNGGHHAKTDQQGNKN